MVSHIFIFSNITPKWYLQRKFMDIDYTNMVYHLSVFSNDFSNVHLLLKPLDIYHKDMVFTCMYPQMILQNAILWKSLWTLMAMSWFLTCMCSQMILQIAYCKMPSDIEHTVITNSFMFWINMYFQFNFISWFIVTLITAMLNSFILKIYF